MKLFANSPNVSVGREPESVIVGDFNGDGIVDIVTANFFDDTVPVSLGNGKKSE
ncbi:MAG: hypothetical protein AAGA40_04785 [Cyanobacteria bacterium P01_E01_bin.45]